MRRLILAVFVAVCAPVALFAQQARGVVRDSAAGTPIPGVVVTVIDSAGTSAGRAITDADGRFAVPAALSASRLRLMRIGYRPREIALSPARPPEIRIAMERIPPMLERVRVSDSELCPGSTDRGAAFQLWEQAGAGLLATVVARELKPADAKTVVYESVMSPVDELIRRQTKSIKSGRTSRPFVAPASPEQFVKAGYLVDDPSSRLYSGPDADVLLHETFAATHCFRVRPPDAAHPGQTGLAFTPVPGREDLVDVDGLIWLDNATPQIRSVDFVYTSLEPVATAAKTGGHIEFRTMPNGVAFIERWHLRLANMQQGASVLGSPVNTRYSGFSVKRRDRADLRVTEMVEAGGIVVEAKWADGTTWLDTPAVIAGIVTRRKTNGPVADAVITLAGTSDTTVTDSAGEFELE
ncbi:MAG TPA: carboxypeptidase-like regulatory domain-containing protein, partial [Gemmatimonadaceae bacterium]